MIKTRIILLVVSLALVAGLFLLPKVVVENDGLDNTPGASNDANTAAAGMHGGATAEVSDAIGQLRIQYRQGSKEEKNAIFADSLANLYKIAGRFDSAAWFAEEASKFFNTSKYWIKAGDLYYQAFTFATDASKQDRMAGKAQALYDQVLTKEPGNLDVKTKKAMTYLSSPNPMQGIMLLREVLAEDPRHEMALFNMGMLSVQSGQYEKAVERLEELVKVNPEHTQGHLLLGISLKETGKRKEAREHFEKVKQLDQDPAVQATVDSYLKDLK